jgi:myosin protein heavy chain
MEEHDENKKKMVREIDNLQQRIDTYSSENDKLNKSKKKLQSEVEDLNVELENHRSNFMNLEKRQRKFDQNLAEEKAISERFVFAYIFNLVM